MRNQFERVRRDSGGGKSSKKIGRVLAAHNGILGVLKEELFDVSAEKASVIEALKRTPSAAMGSCRYKLKSLDQAQGGFRPGAGCLQGTRYTIFFLRGRQRLNGYGGQGK